MPRKLLALLILVIIAAFISLAAAGNFGAASSPLASNTPILTLADPPTPESLIPRLPGCTPGTHVIQIQVNGAAREYRLHVPAELHRQVSLVITLHGYAGTAKGVELYTGFSDIADSQGFLVAYPQALGTPSMWDLEPVGTNQDVQFINALMDDLLQRCPLDAAHIYIAGHSRGGGMAHRLACDLAPRIAAFAAVSGAFYQYQVCSPSRPVPVIAIHGLEDQTVPYYGRAAAPGNLHATPPLPDWAASWASHDGCAPSPDSLSPKKDVKIDTWSHCQDGAVVELYTLASGGHAWPAEPVNASQVIWDFFKLH